MSSDPFSISPTTTDPIALYLDLLKRSLTNWIYAEGEAKLLPDAPFDFRRRLEGRDWPILAQTMIGIQRLNNLQSCVEQVLQDQIPGDLIETGVWRGGATILMRGILQAYGVKDRVVWVADSFEGLPPPNTQKYPHDAGLNLHQYQHLAISLEEVQHHFACYGLLDKQVHFVKGWFKDSLHQAPIEQLSVLRLDGDLYESTMDALTALYPKVAVGGFVIVDDYNDIAACRQAVDDYRREQEISDSIIPIDWTGVYWRRTH
jgi:O-methyltransferase